MAETLEVNDAANAALVGAALAQMASQAKAQADREEAARRRARDSARECSSMRRVEELPGVREVRSVAESYRSAEIEEDEPVERDRWRLRAEAELADGRVISTVAFSAGDLERRLFKAASDELATRPVAAKKG